MEIEDLSCMEKENGSSYFSNQGEKLPYVFYPWRRFFARTLDSFLYEIILAAFLVFVLNINISNRSNWGSILDSFIVILMMLFLEPLWLKLFRTTPGKAIFGLYIENLDGRNLSYSEGLARMWEVIAIGLGYNIPIYNIVRQVKSYRKCVDREIQPWDENLSYTIRDTKIYRNILCLGAYAALFFVLSLINASLLFPPNRGDLTVAQFSENFNYYSKYFDVGFGSKFLNENGEWEEKEMYDTYYINIAEGKDTEYFFDMENGYIKGVSFKIEIENIEHFIMSYDTQMILTSLSFIGAQDEMSLYSKIPKRIIEQIKSNTFKDFTFTEAGVTVICDIEHAGHMDTGSGFLFTEDSTEHNYFSIDFSMIRQ